MYVNEPSLIIGMHLPGRSKSKNKKKLKCIPNVITGILKNNVIAIKTFKISTTIHM